MQQSTDSSPERLSEGAKFGMNMRWGLPYRMTNEVVEFDEPSLIASRHFAGHVWRYRLREVASEVDSDVDDGTEVTEEFDWRTSSPTTPDPESSHEDDVFSVPIPTLFAVFRTENGGERTRDPDHRR